MGPRDDAMRLYCQTCGAARELTELPKVTLTCRCGSIAFGTRQLKIVRRWVLSANDRRFLRSLRIAPDEEPAQPSST